MHNWLETIFTSTTRQGDDIASLQKAVNRSMWLQRELIKRFLREKRRARQQQGKTGGPQERFPERERSDD